MVPMMMKLLGCLVIFASLVNVTPGIANHPPRQIAQASSTSSIQGYCFSVANDNLDSTARIYIQGNQVTGRVEATIHNEQAAYYTSYTQTLQGTKKGNQLNLNITTKIELDTQKTQAIWTLTADSLNTGREVYQRQPCLLSQIRFAPGTNSATVNQSVVRGSRNIYLLRANQGQRMDLKITSLENNAVFDVIAPNGEILTTEATQSSLKLPATGNYEIIVGGTRGNATYKLNVKIQ
jgi:dipeptidyl aminopeptidase/acylaminoacyl peptidase